MKYSIYQYTYVDLYILSCFDAEIMFFSLTILA